MNIKSVNIIHQLPINVVGKVITSMDVESIEENQLGIIIKENTRFGGRILLIPWSNIISLQIEENNESNRDGAGGASAKGNEIPHNNGPIAATAASSRARPEKKQ